MRIRTLICTVLLMSAVMMLLSSFNPQPDPPGVSNYSSTAARSFNPQPDPPGFI